MNTLNCRQVDEQLDLVAAGVCDGPTRQALERHLVSCATCADRYAESQRLQGLLALHWNAVALQRLRQRIEREAVAGRRRLVLPWVRRAAAVAAVLLVTFGLVLLLPRGEPPGEAPRLTLAVLVASTEGPQSKGSPETVARVPAKLAPGAMMAMIQQADGQTGAAFREELTRAQQAGKLPLPPRVPLELALTNSGTRPVEVELGGTLGLDVEGKGVVRLSAEQAAPPDYLHPQTRWLAAGARWTVPVDRLIAGTPGRLEYIYLTEPGDYTVMARLSVRAGGREQMLTSPSVSVQIKGQ
jgi:hypothetical protein